MPAKMTPRQAAHTVRILLQTILQGIEATPQFTAQNLVTLLAVMEEPGATQPDIGKVVGASDPAVLSRQLRYLRGKRQGVVQSPLRPMLVLTPLESDNRVNTVDLTAEGAALSAELARLLNHMTK